jgi:hypothetical protein
VELRFDARSSGDGSGRPLQSVVWSMGPASGSLTGSEGGAVAAAIAAANARASIR